MVQRPIFEDLAKSVYTESSFVQGTRPPGGMTEKEKRERAGAGARGSPRVQ